MASQYEDFGVSFIFISKSFLLQLIILCIILNCRDCIFVSYIVWYDRWKIFDHSSSVIWLVAVAFHFVMPVGFWYSYLINCLYNEFVSVSQKGTILPPRLTNGSLIFDLTGFFLISCRHSIGRLCLIWREFKKLQLVSHFSLISLWLRKSPLSLIMSCIWTMPFAAQLDHIYGLFEIEIYLFSQIVWLSKISTVGILISWSSYPSWKSAPSCICPLIPHWNFIPLYLLKPCKCDTRDMSAFVFLVWYFSFSFTL